jgi:homoserine dehydrogenase
LDEAQRRGFAEADPRNDVEGHDAGHKLTILASLAFRRPVAFAHVPRSGITCVTPDDVALAAERGWRVKLVALARRSAEGIEAGVTAAFVPREHPFARPSGAQNVVRVLGAGSGPLEFFGLGAGGDASGSAVVGDVMAAVEARAHGHAPAHPRVGDPLAVAPLRLPLVVRSAGGVDITEPVGLGAVRDVLARPGVVSVLPLLPAP